MSICQHIHDAWCCKYSISAWAVYIVYFCGRACESLGLQISECTDSHAFLILIAPPGNQRAATIITVCTSGNALKRNCKSRGSRSFGLPDNSHAAVPTSTKSSTKAPSTPVYSCAYRLSYNTISSPNTPKRQKGKDKINTIIPILLYMRHFFLLSSQKL